MAYNARIRRPEFLLSLEQVNSIAGAFGREMAEGLAGRDSSLKMLPSFLTVPDGTEQGRFIAVDFGGSYIRALDVQLDQGKAGILGYQKKALPAAGSASELFGFAAGLVAGLVSPGSYLGHTFSFPCRQVDVNTAYLLTWTKEITTPGVEGQDINRLLHRELAAQGSPVRPVAILNDTVGTLLTAAYNDPHADIAVICGTGHNACYLEPCSPITGRPMIINMESGNFNKLPYTVFDEQLDAASDKPGRQRLEKMAAGGYLGELARLVIVELMAQKILQGADGLTLFGRPYSLTTADIAGWVAQGSVNPWLGERGQAAWSEEQSRLIVPVCREIMLRSAQLAAAAILGTIKHLDPGLAREHTIAIDGSLYEKAAGYAGEVERTISASLGEKAGQVKLKLVKDGSGIGAAIAAAIACKEEV